MRPFTLLEVLVAIAILGMALVLILQILDISRQRLARAERRWSKRHITEQAAELFLLAGPEARVPRNTFPEGYRAEAEMKIDLTDLPEACRETVNGWILSTLFVKVYNPEGKALATQEIRKLMPDNAWH